MSIVEIKFTQSRRNLFHVPERQWKKWSPLARQAFNRVYSEMMKNKTLFLHPEHKPPSNLHWKTIAWNAAWSSAVAVN